MSEPPKTFMECLDELRDSWLAFVLEFARSLWIDSLCWWLAAAIRWVSAADADIQSALDEEDAA